MIAINDELSRDERFVMDAMENSSRRFRSGKTERIGLLVYWLTHHVGWSRERFDDAVSGLLTKGRLIDNNGWRKNPTLSPRPTTPELVSKPFTTRCAYCRMKLTSKTRTKDHVIPVSRGGPDSDDNIVDCCSRCNSMKGDKTPHEWAQSILDYRKPMVCPGWLYRFKVWLAVITGVVKLF